MSVAVSPSPSELASSAITAGSMPAVSSLRSGPPTRAEPACSPGFGSRPGHQVGPGWNGWVLAFDRVGVPPPSLRFSWLQVASQ
jgi:hypothetical protein